MTKAVLFFFLLTLSTLVAAQSVRTLSVADFSQSMAAASQKTILDVRTPAEYQSGHLPGAINLDVRSDAFRKQAALLPSGNAVYVYCLSGVRSQSASGILQTLGFKQIFNLQGGIRAWSQAGKPIETK
ncbi:MAG: rhodanese-like domain-containing protein [Cyclobacteriaceae bacterium]